MKDKSETPPQIPVLSSNKNLGNIIVGSRNIINSSHGIFITASMAAFFGLYFLRQQGVGNQLLPPSPPIIVQPQPAAPQSPVPQTTHPAPPQNVPLAKKVEQLSLQQIDCIEIIQKLYPCVTKGQDTSDLALDTSNQGTQSTE